MTEPPTYAFHRRYVRDVSDIGRGVSNPKERYELIRKTVLDATTSRKQQRQHSKNNSSSSSSSNNKHPSVTKPLSQRIRLYDHHEDVSYVVTAPPLTRVKDVFIDMLVDLALGSVDDIIYIQGIENRNLKKYKSPSDRLVQ